MTSKQFDKFWRHNRQHLIALIKELKKDICDDYRAHEEDTAPGMAITISISENCETWSYQTGDNSFTGSCYGDPYWGTGAIYRRSNSREVADDLISDLGDQIQFEE